MKVFGIGVKENDGQTSSWSIQHRLTYPVISDPEGEIYREYGTGSVPYHVLVDRDFLILRSEEEFKKDSLTEAIRAITGNH